MIINTFGFPKRNLLRRGKREAGSTRNARQVVMGMIGGCKNSARFMLYCPYRLSRSRYVRFPRMESPTMQGTPCSLIGYAILRSQIAANRYRKSKDEHTATEAYNCLTPDANTRHTKVSDYLHAPLPKVSKKSCRALLASGRNLTIGKRQGLLQLFDSDIAETHFRTVTEESDMAFLVLKARMIAVVERAILARLGDIALGDDRTVERHADVVALDPYLLGIPFADPASGNRAWPRSRRKPTRDTGTSRAGCKSEPRYRAPESPYPHRPRRLRAGYGYRFRCWPPRLAGTRTAARSRRTPPSYRGFRRRRCPDRARSLRSRTRSRACFRSSRACSYRRTTTGSPLSAPRPTATSVRSAEVR